ncbi:Transposase (plasmid) [Streptomyces sp. YIM 121038]|uniref:IS110 family transposase n=1 Tax=Streptomyces sp. YIM 121038 TaxID=2136401 RepID=UPI0011104454|nr:Transposase [Streptomyces sp. YIM 121038]
MRRTTDLYPGEGKTGVRDAAIIADAARTMSHALHPIELANEAVTELHIIVGFDDGLVGEATRVTNRLRSLLAQIHPHLKRGLGPRIQYSTVLTLLEQFSSPTGIHKADRRRLVTLSRSKALQRVEWLVADIFMCHPSSIDALASMCVQHRRDDTCQQGALPRASLHGTSSACGIHREGHKRAWRPSTRVLVSRFVARPVFQNAPL